MESTHCLRLNLSIINSSHIILFLKILRICKVLLHKPLYKERGIPVQIMLIILYSLCSVCPAVGALLFCIMV